MALNPSPGIASAVHYFALGIAVTLPFYSILLSRCFLQDSFLYESFCVWFLLILMEGIWQPWMSSWMGGWLVGLWFLSKGLKLGFVDVSVWNSLQTSFLDNLYFLFCRIQRSHLSEITHPCSSVIVTNDCRYPGFWFCVEYKIQSNVRVMKNSVGCLDAYW